MTESPFPFGAAPEAPAHEPEAEPTNRRNVVALGALAAVLLAGGAFFLLGGSEDVDETAFVPPARTSATTPAVVVPKVVKLPVATNVPLGRNPFKALYVQPAAAATDGGPAAGPAVAPAPAGAPAIVPGTPTGASGGTSSGSVPVSGPTYGGAAPAPGTPPPAAEHDLVLRQVSGEGDALSASFTIDGAATRAKVGETFGPTREIKLLSLQEGPEPGRWTAVLQVGDGGPFDAVIGQSVRVR